MAADAEQGGGGAGRGGGGAASAAGVPTVGGGARPSGRSRVGARITVKGSGRMSVMDLKLLVRQARHQVFPSYHPVSN